MSGNLDDRTVDGWNVGNLDDWTVGPFDYNLIQMYDYLADSCVISPTTFLFNVDFCIQVVCSCTTFTVCMNHNNVTPNTCVTTV